MENTTYLNKNFRFVFTPKIKGIYKSNRFYIGGGSIAKYVTAPNAETVQKTALNMKTDKVSLKFRKYGKIEIYVK